MANIIEDIERIAVTLAALDTGKLDSLYDALATRIAGTGARDIAEAIETIRAAGEDPTKYIPVARSYQRQQQMEQRLRHAQEKHELDMRKAHDELQRMENATKLQAQQVGLKA